VCGCDRLGRVGGGGEGLGWGGDAIGGGHEGAGTVEAHHPGAQVAGVGQLTQGAPSVGHSWGLVGGRQHVPPLLGVLKHFCVNCTEILLTRLKPGVH